MSPGFGALFGTPPLSGVCLRVCPKEESESESDSDMEYVDGISTEDNVNYEPTLNLIDNCDSISEQIRKIRLETSIHQESVKIRDQAIRIHNARSIKNLKILSDLDKLNVFP